MALPEHSVPLTFPSGETIEIEYRGTTPFLKLTKQFNIPFTALMDDAYDLAFNQAEEKGVTLYRTSGEIEIFSHKTGEVFVLHYEPTHHELWNVTIEQT